MNGGHYYGYDRPADQTDAWPSRSTVYNGIKMEINITPTGKNLHATPTQRLKQLKIFPFKLIFIGSAICSRSYSALIAIRFHSSETNQIMHNWLQAHININASTYGEL